MATETLKTLKSWLALCLAAAREAEDASDMSELHANRFGDRSEQWFQSHIMLRLNDELRSHYRPQADKGIYVISEAKVSWLDYHCGLINNDHKRTVHGAPKKGLTPKQRFDLAVWNNKAVCGLIEVKNAPSMDGVRSCEDAKKMNEALRRWRDPKPTSLQWGMLIMSERLTEKACNKAQEIGLRNALEEKMRKKLAGIKKVLSAPPVVELEENTNPQSPSLWWGVLVR